MSVQFELACHASISAKIQHRTLHEAVAEPMAEPMAAVQARSDAGMAEATTTIESAERAMLKVVAGIARENRDQTHRVQSVNETIERIDATTQQDSALVEQAAAATESLKDQAEAVRQSLAVFRGT